MTVTDQPVLCELPEAVRPRWVSRSVIGIALAILTAAALVSVQALDSDAGDNLLDLLSAVGRDLGHLRWQFMPIVLVLAVAHYAAATVAARAVSGVPLRWRETFLAQLAASAANRVTPAGIGGAALTARFFTRRGQTAIASIGAVVALSVLGGLADVAVLAALILVAPTLGLGGAGGELSVLTAKLTGWFAPLRSPWMLGALIAAVIALALMRQSRRVALMRAVGNLWAPIRALRGRPLAVLAMVWAACATNLVLGFAFIATIVMVPGPQPHVAAGALLIGFMVAAAAGNALPIPAGGGSTEAALVAVLIESGVPATHSVEAVVIFRLITFWAPAGAGVFAARSLRRAHAL
jgi:uncharacterized membrane protein YbhN (UPF0104 family)